MNYYLPNDERINVKQREFLIANNELPEFSYRLQVKYSVLGFSFWRTVNKSVDSSSLTPSMSIGKMKERLLGI